MRKRKAFLVASLLLLLLGMGAWGCASATPSPPPPEGPGPSIPPSDQVISCEEAIDYLGEIMTVKGVFYCSYRPDVSGEPTFCNCPVPYPDHDFTALIWGNKRSVFESCLGGSAEVLLDRREIRVNGLIEPYRGKAEIILKECDQVTGLQ